MNTFTFMSFSAAKSSHQMEEESNKFDGHEHAASRPTGT